MKDARSEKQIALYLDQMQEIKHRLSYVKSIIDRELGRIEIESVALQIRKVIELIAFAQVSIHHKKYQDRRTVVGENYAKDWNARTIFNHVQKLNPDSYPIPLEPEIKKVPDGTSHFEQLKRSSYLSKNQLLKLYDRCGGLLHADNPWRQKGNKYNNFQNDLPSKIELMKGLLNYHAILINHWEEEITTFLLISMSSLDERPICQILHGEGCSFVSR